MGMHHDVIINKRTFPRNRRDDLEEFCTHQLLLGAGEDAFNESQLFFEIDIRKFNYGGYKNKEKLAAFLQKIAEEELHYEIEVKKRHEDHQKFSEWDWQDEDTSEVDIVDE